MSPRERCGRDARCLSGYGFRERYKFGFSTAAAEARARGARKIPVADALTGAVARFMVSVMLHYNTEAEAHRRAGHAHSAHAAMVALHALCCGLPAALLLVSAGASTGLLGGMVSEAHHFLHAHEVWLMALSAALVGVGGYGEWRAWKAGARRVPWLFFLSILLFAANAAIIAGHRL